MEYFFATNRALNLSFVPSALCLIANTHMQSTIFFPFGKGTSSQVAFFSRVSMARVHLAFAKASCNLLEIEIDDNCSS